MTWENIVVNSKIIGHISEGIYRSAGGALKELVSNAFDANAKNVTITTNWPSFDIVTCRDDGTGMTVDDFKRIMKGGIGDSQKRRSPSNFGRPVIGWLGIGMLAIAQVCHEFRITSHHRATKTAFQGTVRLADFLKEKSDELVTERSTRTSLEVGQFNFEIIKYDEHQAGTYIIAADMRSAFVRKFRDNPGDPLPLNFQLYLDEVCKKRSVKELGDYWQMLWELAVACPIPYLENGPFRWKQIQSSQKMHEELNTLVQSLTDFEFETIVDGLPLRKPNSYPSPLYRSDDEPMSGHLFLIDEEAEVYGRPLKLLGYIYMQDGQAIEPMELRGLLIRIKNVAIGGYDPTFLKYPKIEGPRFNWLSGEVYVETGLEQALNIDRDSFNELHPHFVKMQQIVHTVLEKVFLEASRGTKERSKVKQQDEQLKRREAVNHLLSYELGGNYEIAEVGEATANPLKIDVNQEKIMINSQSSWWPKSKSKREIAQLIAIAYEVSMLAPEEDRREQFYGLLSQLLDL